MTEDQTMLFHYSVIRVVPDPIKDEAINVGVVVVDNVRACGKLRSSTAVRSRIRALKRNYSFESLHRSLEDLATSLGIDVQPELGEDERAAPSLDLLTTTAERLNNQLQLTRPQAYVANSIDDAIERLFRRYVMHRPDQATAEQSLTHAALRNRMWSVVRRWERPNVHVEQGGILDGARARHTADIVVRNGSPRAALFAVPTRLDERHLAYLYRDSLPTIAMDMGDQFQVVAVLPDQDQISSSSEIAFVQETRALLTEGYRVTTIYLEELDGIRDQLVNWLR